MSVDELFKMKEMTHIKEAIEYAVNKDQEIKNKS